jgi:phosphotransferase family enzyme
VTGGYTGATRAIARLADGRTAFVKAAPDDLHRDWLRAEHAMYARLDASFMPRMLGYEDGVLILEELGAAHWPPPWTSEQVAAVHAALDELHAIPPPPGLPRAAGMEDLGNGWPAVARDPEPFLSLGLCSPEWLDEHLVTLLDISEHAPLDGASIVHLDIRSDNVCFAGDRCLIVDWNFASRGNPDLDAALWLPSLRVEGGPEPEGHGALAAVFAGYLACRAGLPVPANIGPRSVRALQRVQLEVALPWAARELGLSRPRPR